MVRPLSMNIVSPRRTPMFLHGYLRHQVGRCAVSLITIATLSGISTAQKYEQKNLVSDVPGWAAVLDPNLVNAWGIDFSATSPVWIADNGTGLSTLYTGTGSIIPLVVTIPPPTGAEGPSAPTGLVFNGTGQFAVTAH